jgi:hypothetical protein
MSSTQPSRAPAGAPFEHRTAPSPQLLAQLRAGNGSAKKKGLLMDELSHLLSPYHRTSTEGACFAWGSGSNYQLGETCAFLRYVCRSK